MTYQAHVHVVDVQTPGWNLLASLGGPGMLKGVGVANSDCREHHIKIEYNGIIISKGPVAASTSAFENTGVTLDVPFDDEEQIKVYARDKPSTQNPNHRYWISLVTGHQPVDSDDD